MIIIKCGHHSLTTRWCTSKWPQDANVTTLHELQGNWRAEHVCTIHRNQNGLCTSSAALQFPWIVPQRFVECGPTVRDTWWQEHVVLLRLPGPGEAMNQGLVIIGGCARVRQDGPILTTDLWDTDTHSLQDEHIVNNNFLGLLNLYKLTNRIFLWMIWDLLI